MIPRVVGLDLSMTATGVCEADGKTWTARTRDAGDRRLLELVAAATVATRGADLVVIEEAPPGLKGPAIKAVHMVHGAVRTALLTQERRYMVVNPVVLKRFATGVASAGKPQMALALFKRFGMELADDDQVDAWWLRAAGLQLLGAPLVPMPSSQVAALDKLAEAVTRG